MLEEYIKETVKKELEKQKLNGIYGKNKHELKQENEKLKKENEILERSYNFINNNTLPELESRVTSKERIATEINLMLNKEKRKAEELKQENEKIKDEINLLKQKNKNNVYRISGCKLIDDTIQEVTLINQTGLEFVVNLLKNNFNLEEYNYFHFYIDNIYICTLQKQFIKTESIEQILYELNDVIGEEPPNYLTLLEQEIDKLKESIEKFDGKLILKDNLLSEQKQENKKLKEKMSIIKGIIHVQHKRTYTNDNLMTTIKLIEDNLKES